MYIHIHNTYIYIYTYICIHIHRYTNHKHNNTMTSYSAIAVHPFRSPLCVNYRYPSAPRASRTGQHIARGPTDSEASRADRVGKGRRRNAAETAGAGIIICFI